jgi:NAD(P)-dependent dehydrogenase (short-subunit alcohol dehydrogenase family)
MMEPGLCTLITGASSGIGREIAIRLSASRPLIVHGRDAARIEETIRHCDNPERHVPWSFDLREVDQIEDAVTALIATHRIAVDGFVHCAGALSVLPLRTIDAKSLRHIFDVNFASAFEMTRLLTRNKVNAHHLTGVVFVSSIASRFGARGFSAYCASKGALDAFMRAAAVELGPRVRLNSVLPGAVRTAMTNDMLDDRELAARMGADYPLGLGKPSDVASAVEFLLSDAARWITGQQLAVDGGRSVNISP